MESIMAVRAQARPITFLGVSLVAASWLQGGVLAQHSSGSPTEDVARVRAAVAALGSEWNEDVNAKTADLYVELHRRHDNSGIRRIRDVSYGPHAQQKLDLFVPNQGFDELGPVFVFLHGGAPTGGDKIVAGTDDLLYSNVAKWAARVGGVGINANYRLLPEAKWPSGADDVRTLIDWTRKNAAEHGGDPSSIIVLANAVGAMHLAGYLFHEPAQLDDGPGIAGAILSSGAFESTTASHPMRLYFGEHGASQMPLNLVDGYEGKSVPLLLLSAEYDPLESGVAEMNEKLCRKYGACPMFVRLARHNHVSPVMSIDSADTSVTNEIIRFYHSVVRK
jgi:triacylglycerol lipase